MSENHDMNLARLDYLEERNACLRKALEKILEHGWATTEDFKEGKGKSTRERILEIENIAKAALKGEIA